MHPPVRRESGQYYYRRRLNVQFNPMTSKTVIGAIIVAIGIIADSGIFGQENTAFIHSLGTLLTAIGTVVTAWGVRHAVAKAAQGVVQMNPLVTLMALAAVMLGVQPLPRAPMTLTANEEYSAAGDSLKYVISWKQPPDTAALGKIDSTFYRFISSKGLTFFGSTGLTTPNVAVRRTLTGIADSFKLVKPPLGDSVTFQITNFQQCRKGDCSSPQSAGWKYRRSFAPTPASAPDIQLKEF
jgi:cation transport ATPase